MTRPRLKDQDTEPLLLRAYDDSGQPVDLTGATLTLGARRTLASPLVVLDTDTADPAEGYFYWVREAGELVPGCWRLELAVERDGERVTYPSGVTPDYYEVDVVASLTPGVTP